MVILTTCIMAQLEVCITVTFLTGFSSIWIHSVQMTSHLETLHPKNIHIWDNSEVQKEHLDEFNLTILTAQGYSTKILFGKHQKTLKFM